MPKKKSPYEPIGYVDGEKVFSHYVCGKCGMNYLNLDMHRCDLDITKRLERKRKAVFRRKRTW